MISTQYINLNMTPKGVLPVLHCSQYDIGRPLGVVVYNGSETVDISQYTVTVEATRTDGTPITAAVTTDGNIGAFVTTATMTNKDDLYPAQLVIVDGDSNRVASLPFMMCVVKAAMDENSEEIEEDAPLYQQYNTALQALIVAVRADLNAEVTARQTAVAAEAATRTAADNTLQSNINAEASTRATQDAVLQAEINQLIAPSGSAPSAAEVENARTSADGIIYATLGDAIRAQDANLKNQLNSVQKDLYGKYQIFTPWTTGVFEAAGYTNGTNTNYCHSDKLPAGKYAVSAESGYYFEIYTYVSDSQGTSVRGMAGTSYTFTASDPFVISSRKNPSATITDDDKRAYNSKIKILLVSSDTGLVNDVSDLEDLSAGHTKDELLMDGILFFYKAQRPTITKSGTSFSVTVQINPRGMYVKDGLFLPITNTVTSATYSVPSSSNFVYNLSTGLFAVMTYQEINASADELIFLFHNNNGYLYGQWERFVIEDKITEAITECKAYADSVAGLGTLPEYYDSYMPDRLSTIRSNIASVGNSGISFAFVSDVHYDRAGENNTRNSPILLNVISRKTAVKMMICGGDLITLDDSKDKAMELMQDTITDFTNKSQMDTFWAVGNHEFNNPGATEAGAVNQLTTDEVVPIITQGRFLYIKYIHSSGAYIVDIPKDRTRILFNSCNYDSSLNTSAEAWLISMLDSTPTDYDLILISHLGIYRNTSNVYTGPVDDFKPLLAALQAYKQHTTYTYNDVTYNFTGKTGTVLGAFLGHYHSDGQGVWYGIPCCIITTDSLNESQYSPLTRTSGTTTEQAFDVVTINRSNGSIYCTRIGAGNDRQYVNGEWTVIS